MPGGFEHPREKTGHSSRLALLNSDLFRDFSFFVSVVLSSWFFQEVEKARQAQESITRELRAKSEADRATHVEEVERIEVRCSGKTD